MLLLHNGVLTHLAEIPAAADRPTSVLKEDVAAALASSTLCDQPRTHPRASLYNDFQPTCILSSDHVVPWHRPVVVATRESLGWDPVGNRVRLRDCKGAEVGKVIQEHKKLKSVG